jgi:hypothetical protein
MIKISNTNEYLLLDFGSAHEKPRNSANKNCAAEKCVQFIGSTNGTFQNSANNQLQSHFTSPRTRVAKPHKILLPNPAINGGSPQKRTNQDSETSASHPGNKQKRRGQAGTHHVSSAGDRAALPRLEGWTPGALRSDGRRRGSAGGGADGRSPPLGHRPIAGLLAAARSARARGGGGGGRWRGAARAGAAAVAAAMRRERRWGVGGGRRDRGTRREERTGASARQERKERWVGVARPNGRLISCTAMIKER